MRKPIRCLGKNSNSMGLYYHKEVREALKEIDNERMMFAEQYEKYLHLASDQSIKIKELEKKLEIAVEALGSINHYYWTATEAYASDMCHIVDIALLQLKKEETK